MRDEYRWSARVKRAGQRQIGVVLRTPDHRRVANEAEARESFERLSAGAEAGTYVALVKQLVAPWETVVYIQR